MSEVVVQSCVSSSVDLASPPIRLAGRVEKLQAVVRDLSERRPRPRAERLSGMHNPWGHAAPLANAWTFLDVCEDESILESVSRLIGPDIILWDSELHLEASSYLRFVREGREGRYWPTVPLAGAVALVSPDQPDAAVLCIDLASIAPGQLACLKDEQPLYVIRYMSASSRFERNAQMPANWIAMEQQPLLNYTTRPLWLVRGEDHAGNDFVTGFSPPVPRWAGSKLPED